MNKDEVLRILVGNGFKIVSVTPQPNYHLFLIDGRDVFGAANRRHIAVASGNFSGADIGWLEKIEDRTKAPVVLVGEESPKTKLVFLTHDQFKDRLGGSILSLLPLDPDYEDRLVKLGRNELPSGLLGDPSDLFEEYVHAGLQFLLGTRVVRFGQERRFEKLADGISVGDSAPILLYDAKAYAKGYEVTAESIRQFSSYVKDYDARYGSRVGRAFAFPVISGEFVNGTESMVNKNADMRAEAGNVGLCFLRASDLAGIVRLAATRPLLRKSVDWKRLFGKLELTEANFAEALAAREKDGI